MQVLLMDGIKDVVLHNGMVRVDCVSVGPNGRENPSGTLVIPANIVAAVVQTLAGALQELDKKIREQQAAAADSASTSAS